MKDRASICQSPLKNGHGFGIDPAATAAMLRDIAADLDAGSIGVHKVTQEIVAAIDEFGMATLTFTYFEKAAK